MSELGDATPRRALPPRDDDVDDAFDDDAAQAPRRGAWSATGPETAPSRAATPIPPPAVLPVSEVAPASAGRRFSAVDLPVDEERPLPRRSALSPAATRAMSPRTPDSPDDGTDAAAASPRSYRKLAIGIVVALVVAAIAITAFVLLNPPPGSGRPGEPPTPAIDPVATYLVQPADLDAVLPATTWQADATVTKVDPSTPTPKCIVPVLESEVQPASTLVRTFAPTAGTAAGLLHQVENYSTAEEATAAYADRLAQLGTCERNTAWVQEGKEFTGLADEATGVALVLQGDAPEYHTIVLSRTGTRVNIVDATQAQSALPAGSLLPALGATFARQCTDNGTCPASPTVVEGVPAPTDPAGYLASVDLPRITAGAGAWRGVKVADTVTTNGSRCEAIDLKAPPTSVTQQQRTMILQDDAAAPTDFGVDEVLYTFNTPEEANALVSTLATNIDDCGPRTGTAEVARSGDLTGAGTGTAWVVTRKVDQSEGTARFRVAVLAAGKHVVYLMANPTAEFDFSDQAWHGVALRAAERLTQLP